MTKMESFKTVITWTNSVNQQTYMNSSRKKYLALLNECKY